MPDDRSDALEPCRPCVYPFPRGTVHRIQPLARIAPGSSECHRLVLDDHPVGHMTRIESGIAARDPHGPPGSEIARESADPTGALLAVQEDVDVEVGKRARKAYDLALFQHADDGTRAVLVVTSIVKMIFQDGTSSAAATSGDPLEWLDVEKQAYAAQFVTVCTEAWSDQHVIMDTSLRGTFEFVSVRFAPRVVIDGAHPRCHWVATVAKVDERRTSGVTSETKNVKLDGFDIWTDVKGRELIQFAAAHEFGHMLGLPDEYVVSSGLYAATWASDETSIMNRGSEVRARHYAPFADWLSRWLATTGRPGRKAIVYKVGGTVDLTNAELTI